MFRTVVSTIASLFLATLLLTVLAESSDACSTFKLQKGDEFFYGHVLDEPGMTIPGMIYINQRGVFKKGRSYGEMFSTDKPILFYSGVVEESELSWISRYGSVTMSQWGRDFPDGGYNEAGLFIWEMGMVGTGYPVDNNLPRLLQMNWMQYILDNCCTIDEAITAAHDIELKGWHWHYFVGDRVGNCATIEFFDGKVVVHRGEDLPIPVLFNDSYEREMEQLRAFKGFGGTYDIDFENKHVPRIAKSAAMIRDFDPENDDGLKYARELLWQVGNKPYKWGILIDVNRQVVHFATEDHLKWKSFSLKDIDFSHNGPVMTLPLDQEKDGDVSSRFHPMQDSEAEELLMKFGLPDSFFDFFGFTREQYAHKFATAYHLSEETEYHYFAGVWSGVGNKKDDSGNAEQFTLTLICDGSNVDGTVVFKGSEYSIQHIRLIDKELSFTFINDEGRIFFPKGAIDKDIIDLEVRRNSRFIDNYRLIRQ